NIWTNTGNWVEGNFPNAVGHTASFGAASGSGNIDLNGNKTVSGIIFNNGGTSYNLGGTGTLTLDNRAAASPIAVQDGMKTITAPSTLNGEVPIITTNAADPLTFAGNMSGAWPITVNGPGTLNLYGTNTFTTLSTNGGAVNVGSGGAGGTLG